MDNNHLDTHHDTHDLLTTTVVFNGDDDNASTDKNRALIEELNQKLRADFALFNDYVNDNCVAIDEISAGNPEIVTSVTERLEQAIEKGYACCATTLGALYYDGLIVEQSYTQAAHYYEEGARLGEIQSMINLGYIYEYGRLGQRDFARAFTYYATAQALSENGNFEALFKMGDLYNRGAGVPLDKKMALRLWIESYHSAFTPEEEASAALRLAPYFLKKEEEGLYSLSFFSFNPMKALQFYQTAEIGFRIAINKGMAYYQRQLEQAIEGQETARFYLDDDPCFDSFDTSKKQMPKYVQC